MVAVAVALILSVPGLTNGGHDDKKVSDSGVVRSADSFVAAADSRAAFLGLAWPGLGLDLPVVLVGEPGDAGGDVPAEPSPIPEPEPTAVPLTDIEAAICSAGWSSAGLCDKALRVARCESGPDYYSEAGTYHVGTFQIAYVHAWRFLAHGWDIYDDGLDPARNSVIAFEIWSESGWGPWPWCGYR